MLYLLGFLKDHSFCFTIVTKQGSCPRVSLIANFTFLRTLEKHLLQMDRLKTDTTTDKWIDE